MASVFVTGASSGIGLATVARLARAGHDVYAGSRNPAAPGLSALKDEDLPVRAVRLDLNDPRSIAAAAEEVHSGGDLDCLVNNAGVARGSNAEESDMNAVREMFEANFFGPAELVKHILPRMRARRSGVIVNVTSIAGRLVTVSGGFYAASKYAFEAYSEALAMQVADFGVRVRIIEPGATTTDMFANAQKAAPPANPTSPYQRMSRRFGAFFQTQLGRPDATPPDAVAQVIEEAIFSDEYRLRWVTGDDAQALLVGRERMSDEDMVSLGRVADDETYFNRMAEIHGCDLFRPAPDKPA